jgi:hypothetical protein
MASQKALCCHIKAPDGAELPYRFDGVLAASRHKSALTAKELPGTRLVKSYYQHNRFFYKTAYFICSGFFQNVSALAGQVQLNSVLLGLK